MTRATLRSATLLVVAVNSNISMAFAPIERPLSLRYCYDDCKNTFVTRRRRLGTRIDDERRATESGSSEAENAAALIRHSDHRRRQLFSSAFSSAAAAMLICPYGHASHARGWVQFPCVTPLANSYHLLRAGTTLLEEEGTRRSAAAAAAVMMHAWM